jgi:hypothetical protein
MRRHVLERQLLPIRIWLLQKAHGALRIVVCIEHLALVYARQDQPRIIRGVIFAIAEIHAVIQPLIPLSSSLRF